MKKRQTGPETSMPGWRLVFCGVVILGLFGCHGRNSENAIVIESDVSRPARVGTATVRVRLADASGKSLSGAQVSLEGDMSHAGMGPTFGEAKEVSPGRYEGTLQFNMAGDWVVLTRVILSDGRKFEQQTNVNGVQAN